jgi:GNAT superfamily N-acetyltransferase
MLITTTKTTADLQGVLDLQQQNQKRNVPPDVQRDQGFVTLQYTLDQMQKMHALGPSVIAKDGGRVVGYAITAMPEASAFVPELATLFSLLQTIDYKGQPLSAYAHYLVGQVCVADGYRGQGIFDQMYQHHRDLYSNRFRLFITDISMRNTRSLRAHERVGFQLVHQFYEPDAQEEWGVVVWDWEKGSR